MPRAGGWGKSGGRLCALGGCACAPGKIDRGVEECGGDGGCVRRRRGTGENCIFRILNIALRSFAISNTDFVKIELQTCDT